MRCHRHAAAGIPAQVDRWRVANDGDASIDPLTRREMVATA